jgi:hypothetical protein
VMKRLDLSGLMLRPMNGGDVCKIDLLLTLDTSRHSRNSVCCRGE